MAAGAAGPWMATGGPCSWLRGSGMVCVPGGREAPVEGAESQGETNKKLQCVQPGQVFDTGG